MPPGVLNVVQGVGEDAGAALVAHPDVDRISFTGSPETGRARSPPPPPSTSRPSASSSAASRRSSSSPTPTSTTRRSTVCGQFVNAGQVCLAGTRLLVHADVADELFARVLQRAAGVPGRRSPRPGDAHRPADPSRALRARGRLRRARARRRRDGRCSAAGRAPSAPLCFEPTILGDVDQRQRDRAARGVRPGAHVADVRRRRRGRRARQRHRVRPGRDRVHPRRQTRRPRHVGAAWPARCGSTASSCATSRRRSAASKLSGIGREGGTWSFDFFCDVKNVAVRDGSFGSSSEARHG